MDFTYDETELALRDELRRFLGDACDADRRRAAIDLPGAVDRDLWGELASMGVFSVSLSEEDGGVGLGLAHATIVFEELGRALVPGPTIATFLAAGLVEGAADGSSVVGALTAEDRPVVLEHADGLDELLVISDSGVQRARATGGRPVERPLDPLTPVHLDATFEPLGDPLGGADLSVRIHRDAALLSGAFQVGLAQGALEMATDYAKQRQQFGRPIGSFQAVKHLLADAASGVDVARAAVQAAAVGIDEGDQVNAEAARVVASRAAERSCTTCIQVHGGMGYTWELDAHLYLKRSRFLDQSFGGVDAAIESVAATL